MLKQFDISLKDEIESQVLKLNYKDHNLSFTNMYMWRGMYKLSVYSSEKFIIVFCDLNGEFFSLNPICVLEDVDQAIEYLIKYFKDHNLPFIIHNCVMKVKDVIEAIYGDFFVYELARDSFDYLYSAEKLMTYSGKKLQKKRNHINNFKKLYGDRYELKLIEGNEQVIADCIQFTKQWDDSKTERDMYIDQEVSGAIDVLNNISRLSCQGLAVYLDNTIQGYSIGTQLNDTTAVLNIEKANGNIIGLYPFLRQQMVTTFFSDLKHINTEDDVGEENLRKSKLSYQPEYLVNKYTVRRKDEVSSSQ